MPIVAEIPTAVKVHTTILPDLLYTAVAAIYADPRRTTAYTDLFPPTADAWVVAVLTGRFLPVVWTVSDVFGGLFWLHDLGVLDDRHFAWVGMFVDPSCRKQPHIGAAAWQHVEAWATAEGITHLFGACQVTNLPAQRFVLDWLGFVSPGTYRDWMPVQGIWQTWHMNTRHLAHQNLLWVSAEQRHAHAKALLQARA